MKKEIKVNTVLFIILILTILISLNLGKYPISVKKIFEILFSPFIKGEASFTKQEYAILMNTRLPRVILAVLVGASLSASGAVYQGIFRNPIVSPDVLGASTGAAFGAALAIINELPSYGIMISAFTFSMITVMLVYFISLRGRGDRVLTLVLSGIMISAMFQSATSYLKLMADPNLHLPAITYWLMGSLSGATLKDIRTVIIPMLFGLVLMYLLRWQINILTMGDREALTMGVSVNKTRLLLIVAATLTTASSIAVAGLIGWIGLVIPHFARLLVGSDYRKMYVTTILSGGIFLLAVDDLSRMLTTSEIPISIITSFIGAPLFIYLLNRKKIG